MRFALILALGASLGTASEAAVPPVRYALSHTFSSLRSGPHGGWTPFGSIESGELPGSLQHAIDSTANGQRASTSDADDWYLVKLDVGTDDDKRELIASTKACLLSPSHPFALAVHYSTDPAVSPSAEPVALTFYLSPSAPSTCPPDSSAHISLPPPQPIGIWTATPSRPREPTLAPPAPVNGKGETVVPEPEKSFLAKNWVWIVGGGMVIFSLMTQEDPAKRGEGGGATGGGGAAR